MANFIPESDDLRKALIFCFHLKKSAAESHRMLVEAYGDHALSEATCKRWFQQFRDNDFDVRNEERGRPPKKFEDAELQAILDEDDTLSQKQMAEMLNVKFEPCIDRKTTRMGQKTRQSNFVTRQCTCTQSKNGSGNNQSTWLGAATPPAVFTRLGPFRLPFVFIDGTRIGKAALRFLRRSRKLGV